MDVVSLVMVLHALRVPTVLIVDLVRIFCDLLVASDCTAKTKGCFNPAWLPHLQLPAKECTYKQIS